MSLPPTAPLTTAEWMESALCRQVDPEIFFPEERAYRYIAATKGVCQACPVTERCLQLALDNDESEGIWGGLTAHERRKLKRRGEAA